MPGKNHHITEDIFRSNPPYTTCTKVYRNIPQVLISIQVMPILITVLLHSKEEERKNLVENLAKLVGLLRQHLRKWLPDLLHLIDVFWTSDPPLQLWLLKLVKELASEFSVFLTIFLQNTISLVLCLLNSKMVPNLWNITVVFSLIQFFPPKISRGSEMSLMDPSCKEKGRLIVEFIMLIKVLGISS